MSKEQVHHLADVSFGQHGVITARQAAVAGLTAEEVRGRLRSGDLERAGAHVLRSAFVERTVLSDLSALVLDCGDGAVASGPSAAALHAFDGIGWRQPFHVTIPRGRLVTRAGHQIHTTNDLAAIDRTRVLGIPVMTPARTLIDVARYVRAPTLTAALDGALRDRLITEEMLHQRIVSLRSRGRYGIPALLDVLVGREVTRGGHSWLERRFLEICARARLPRPTTQEVLTSAKGRLVRVDFWFPATSIVVEVLGYHFHRGDRHQMSRDSERINALLRDGLCPYQFTYDHVTAQPQWVVDELCTALRIPRRRLTPV